MLQKCSVIFLIVAMVFVIGCASHTHTVGQGPVFNRTEVQRQWYLLYGLVPVNDIDTQAMADGRSNYEITTEITMVDFLFYAILSPATITSRTVIVTR